MALRVLQDQGQATVGGDGFSWLEQTFGMHKTDATDWETTQPS